MEREVACLVLLSSISRSSPQTLGRPDSNPVQAGEVREDEKNVPAEPETAQEGTRIPNPHAQQGGTRRHRPPSPQGPPPVGWVKAGNFSKDSTQRPRRFERLRRKADFDTVYARGRRVPGRFFIGYYLFQDQGPLRLGVVASRRLGSAVRRNRAKRRLREVFRRNEPRETIAADVVLIARSAIIEASFEEIHRAYVRGVGRFLEEGRRHSQNR